MKKLFYIAILSVFLSIAFLIVLFYLSTETLIIDRNRGKKKMPITPLIVVGIIAGATAVVIGGTTIGIVVAVNKSKAHKIDEEFKKKELEALLDQAYVEIEKTIEALDDVTKSRRIMSDNLFKKKMLERQCYVKQNDLNEELKREKITKGQKFLDAIDFLDVISSKEEKDYRKNAINLQIESIVKNRKTEIEKLTNAVYGCEALHKKNLVNTKKNLQQLEELYDSAIQHIALYNEKSKIAFRHKTEVQKVAMIEAFKLLLACRNENGELSEKLLIGFLDYFEMSTNCAREVMMNEGISVAEIAEQETNTLMTLKKKVDREDLIEFVPYINSNLVDKDYNPERLPLICGSKQIADAHRYIEEKKVKPENELSTFEELEFEMGKKIVEIDEKERKREMIDEKIKKTNSELFQLVDSIDKPFAQNSESFGLY